MAYEYETLPGGHTPENARKALDKAVENGFPEESVLTQSDGSFLIPVSEYEPEDALSASEAVVNGFPGEDNSGLAPDEDEDEIGGMSVAELDQYAADNEIELKSGLNKADKAAAIRAALADKE